MQPLPPPPPPPLCVVMVTCLVCVEGPLHVDHEGRHHGPHPAVVQEHHLAQTATNHNTTHPSCMDRSISYQLSGFAPPYLLSSGSAKSRSRRAKGLHCMGRYSSADTGNHRTSCSLTHRHPSIHHRHTPPRARAPPSLPPSSSAPWPSLLPGRSHQGGSAASFLPSRAPHLLPGRDSGRSVRM